MPKSAVPQLVVAVYITTHITIRHSTHVLEAALNNTKENNGKM